MEVQTKDDVVDVFIAFVELCGSYSVRSEEEGQQVLQEALTALETMHTVHRLRPNATTYASLLQACGKLLPVGNERDRAVENVFLFCCQDGAVNGHVLKQLRSVVTPEEYTKLVIAQSEELEGVKVVPEAWTTRELGGKVVSADGRRALPLSIDGSLIVTTAMQNFQSRKILDKRNRNLLRGGRWRKKVDNRWRWPREQAASASKL
jgi:hypothetical protein